MSKNEVAKQESIQRKLIVLCPKLDGLQAKYSIVYVPEGTTYIEQRTDLVNFVYEKFSSLLNGKKIFYNWMHIASVGYFMSLNSLKKKFT